MTEQPLSNEERWPSVEAAFGFVQPSYVLVVQRIDAQEARIRAIMTFATTGTFAVLAFLTGPLDRRDFVSPWFALGVGLYVLLMVLGILSAVVTEVRLIDPNELYNTMLDSPSGRKKDLIALAGDDFRANSNTASRLSLVLLGMALEAACFVVWSVHVGPTGGLP